ncbi:MAG: FecR domain-containing protein [Tannerellaceae bacterium]|jgi:ferric-dicitrate binding protein FerR (iron transport regulator)|nr:FecR domain-containing protein [Tannerellaceae bacterium]
MNHQAEDAQIVHLLQRYIENKCDEQELHLLLTWLQSTDEPLHFYSASRSLWERLDKTCHHPDDKRTVELDREVDILLQKIKSRNALPPHKQLPRRRFLFRIASVCLLLIGIGGGYLYLNNGLPDKQTTYTEIYARCGEIREHMLNDGTRVILNSETKLVIPSDYNRENRSVEMIGEGFFDVTPDAGKPFIIRSGEARVKVLGTSFNVKAYTEDQTIGVTVSSGKVQVNIPETDLQLQVMPMEHLTIHKASGTLSKIALTENIYKKWIDGSLYFEKEPLSEVIKTINRKYDRNVVLRCKNCNPIISGTHDNKSIEAVVETICFTTGLKYKEEGKQIIIYND